MFRLCSDSGADCKYTKNFRDYQIFINKINDMRTRKVIQLPKGAAPKICNHLKIGTTTLYAALNYTSNSEDAKHTRKVALSEYGGVEIRKPIF